MDLKSAQIYSRLPEFQYLLRRTHAFIDNCLSQVQKPYLACSFGKDSAAMLDMVLEHKPDIPVVFVSRVETNLVDNYEEVIAQWKHRINLVEVRFEGNTFSYINKSVIKTGMLQIQDQYDSYFVGLRAQESVGRRISLRKDGKFFLKQDGLVRICPVAFWKERDIAAYNLSRNLPVLGTYLAEGFSARTTAGISSKTPHESIQSLRSRNIAAYNQLLALLPDAKYFS